jgi:hypothetical protein
VIEFVDWTYELLHWVPSCYCCTVEWLQYQIKVVSSGCSIQLPSAVCCWPIRMAVGRGENLKLR